MSKKVKVNDELIEKAKAIFGKDTSVRPNGSGLTRTELRALERKGLVEKMRTAAGRKWVDTTSAMAWRYFRKGF